MLKLIKEREVFSMSKLDILAEEILVKINGKRVLCKAVLLSDKGGHVVSYLVDGVEVKSQPLYRSPFKDKVKEIKASKQEQKQPLSELLETLRETCVSMGVTNQQLAEKYGIPSQTVKAWFDGTAPDDYIITLLLRCLEVDFIADLNIDLSEEEQEQEPSETAPKPYKLYNLEGEPLTSAEEEFVHRERAAGRTTKVELSQDEDPYRTRKVRCCDSNNFKFEVIKEV